MITRNKRIASNVAMKMVEALNMEYFEQQEEVPWKFLEIDPYEFAIGELREHLANWLEHPTRSVKNALIQTWEELHPELKVALDKENSRVMGGSPSVMWRIEPSGNFPTNWGGYSLHDSLDTDRALDFVLNRDDKESNWKVSDQIRGYKVAPNDVLTHYKTRNNPLQSSRWVHEGEVILKPRAKPILLSERDMLTHLYPLAR